jgi:thiamine kinase-like enzyme
LARLREHALRLEESQGPVTIVFGHNDLLAANFIDDGVRLWLIDWDYAGFNTPLFDLANLSSNNALTHELDLYLLEAYFQEPADAARLRAFTAMKCASLLREALWGAVSLIKSSIPFDYGSYARDYLNRFNTLWQHFESDHG